jgi:hypothetical protein
MTGLPLLSGAAAAKAFCPRVGFTIVEPHASRVTRPVKAGKDQTLFVRRVPITTTSDIVEIKLVADGQDDASLLIKFTPAAAQRLHDATTNHSGLRIAFMADDDVLLDAVWEGPYGMETYGTQVSMRHGMKRAQRLVKAIRGCTDATAYSFHPSGGSVPPLIWRVL